MLIFAEEVRESGAPEGELRSKVRTNHKLHLHMTLDQDQARDQLAGGRCSRNAPSGLSLVTQKRDKADHRINVNLISI